MAFQVEELSIQLIELLVPLMPRIKQRDKALEDQLRRAASSIGLNCAEAAFSDPGNRRALSHSGRQCWRNVGGSARRCRVGHRRAGGRRGRYGTPRPHPANAVEADSRLGAQGRSGVPGAAAAAFCKLCCALAAPRARPPLHAPRADAAPSRSRPPKPLDARR